MQPPNNSVTAGRGPAFARGIRRFAARLMICAPLAGASAVPAMAADLQDGSFLRGSFDGFSAAPAGWDGTYIGGHFGYSNLHVPYGDSLALITVPNVTTNDITYGGFIGYNVQTDPQLVLGAEFGYTASQSLASTSTASAAGTTSTASYQLNDFGTARLRAGYPIGRFLPYAAIGIAVGRVDYSIFSVTGGAVVQNLSRDNALTVGAEAALGVDMAIMSNMFLRAEWEYIYFSALKGITSDISTVRAGVGVRF